MKFNFRESRNTHGKRLFVPVNPFSFSAFAVKIKFRQPAPRWAPAFGLGLKSRPDEIIARAV